MGKDIKRDKKNFNANQKELITLFSNEFQECYDYYKELKNKRPILSQKQIISAMDEKVEEIVGNSMPGVSEHLINKFESENLVDIRNTEIDEKTEYIKIGQQDYETYKKLVSVDPDITQLGKQLLFTLVYFYRANYHHTGWIRYDKKFIFHLAGIDELAKKQQEQITQYLHRLYGLDMRVIGSNSPTPCFKIDWLYSLGEVGIGDNKELNLGILSKEAIKQLC